MSMRLGMATPWMDAVASSVSRHEAKIIYDVGHFAMIEGARPVNKAIENFARSLGCRRYHWCRPGNNACHVIRCGCPNGWRLWRGSPAYRRC